MKTNHKCPVCDEDLHEEETSLLSCKSESCKGDEYYIKDGIVTPLQ